MDRCVTPTVIQKRLFILWTWFISLFSRNMLNDLWVWKIIYFCEKFLLEPSQVTIHKCSIEDQRYQCTDILRAIEKGRIGLCKGCVLVIRTFFHYTCLILLGFSFPRRFRLTSLLEICTETCLNKPQGTNFLRWLIIVVADRSGRAV